jgi:hypothetical protein
MQEKALWQYFREIHEALKSAESGKDSPPYQSGTFMVTAVADEVEFTVKDVSEEDAVLIASELQARGVLASLYATVICPSCGQRVALISHCSSCRAKLSQPST